MKHQLVELLLKLHTCVVTCFTCMGLYTCNHLGFCLNTTVCLIIRFLHLILKKLEEAAILISCLYVVFIMCNVCFLCMFINVLISSSPV